MLKNIPLIASIISALTAVTTSLRALGKSRELKRHELSSNIRAGCRIDERNDRRPSGKGNSILIHLIVTIIWFVLSFIFALPLISQWKDGGTFSILQTLLPFFLLLVLLGFIWWKVLRTTKA